MKAIEKYKRAERGFLVSKESLADLKTKLTEAEGALKGVVVQLEIGEGQRRTVDKWDREVRTLKAQIEEHERSVAALESALPQLRTDAEIEEVQESGASSYRGTHARYVELIGAPPSTDNLTSFIAEVSSFIDKLHQVQDNFLAAGRNLNLAMLEHKLNEVNGITCKNLQVDREAADRTSVEQFADQVMLASEKFRELSSNIFYVIAVEYSDLQHRIEIPPEPDIEEICPCGYHRRVYEPSSNVWKIFAKPGALEAPSGATSEVRYAEALGRENLPPWPCEK